jgi:hypothetical protein
MASRRSSILLLFGSCVIGLVLGEIMLRMFTVFPIHHPRANRQPHAVLGHVMDPALAEIDAAGFRNTEAGVHSDIVAIGDSHTYGFNVSSASSWPHLVSRRTGLSVYNFGIGAYGILHYKYVFDLALARHPKTVILGLYIPNDLAEICRTALLDYWQPHLTEHHFSNQICPVPKDGDNRVIRIVGDVLRNVAITSAVHFLLTDSWGIIGGPSLEVAYGSHRTTISVDLVRRYRIGMDLASPVVEQTYRIARLVLAEMIERSREQNVDFTVLIIPSKQNVLAHLIDKDDPFYDLITESVALERGLATRFDKFLTGHGVRVAHVLPCLIEHLDLPLFPESSDGHPIESGYDCYAAAAISLISESMIWRDSTTGGTFGIE